MQTQTRPHVFIICPQINTVMVRQSSPVDLFLLFSPSPLLPSMWVCVCECVWPVCWFTGNTRPKEFPRWSQPYLPPIKIHELQLMILVSSLTEWLDFSWRWSDIVSTALALRCLYPSSWRNVNLIVTSCFVRNLGKKVWREQSTPVNIVCGISPHTTDQEHCTGVRSNHEQSHDFGTVCFSSLTVLFTLCGKESVQTLCIYLYRLPLTKQNHS